MLPAHGLYGHIRNNNLKSAALLAGFLLLTAVFWYALTFLWTAIVWSPPKSVRVESIDHYVLLVATHAVGEALQRWYIPILAGFAWLMIAYTFHAQMIHWATGTKEVTRRDHPKLYNMVERLAIEAGLPMPRIEVMNTGALNAYAAGLSPETATIAVTRGLITSLTPAELEAVLAHEMTHIQNRDVRLMVVAIVMAGGLTFVGEMARLAFSTGGRSNSGWTVGDIADVGVGLPDLSDTEGDGRVAAGALIATLVSIGVAILLLATVHLFALLTKFAISRSREYLADAGAVELTRNPDALISALTKISGHDAVPGVPASLCAMMISNPFEGLLSTHPSIADRIAKLRAFAGGAVVEPRRRHRWGSDASTAAQPGTEAVAASQPWGPGSDQSAPTYPSPAGSLSPRAGFLPAGTIAGFGRRRPRRRIA